MWVSSSVIVCKSVSGSGEQVGAVIYQTDQHVSFACSVISYNGSAVSSIELSGLPASGSTFVTVLGAKLASSSRSLAVSLGRTYCAVYQANCPSSGNVRITVLAKQCRSLFYRCSSCQRWCYLCINGMDFGFIDGMSHFHRCRFVSAC